ncbi:MAG: hypothetical protein COB02_10230 [Candidatus Cloacimonadota bacterium]|nr:MAG: hypothetical protein COB02_10230 [Candidatus Cloacimonadota bacterium]
MKCETILEKLYESSLNDMSNDLMTHLKVCKSCEQEYLKIQRLEMSFLKADKKEKKASNFIRNLSIATAAFCMFYFQPNEIEKSVNIKEDMYVMILDEIVDEDDAIFNKFYLDAIDYEINTFETDFGLVEENIYDYALTTIENKLYNDLLEG